MRRFPFRPILAGVLLGAALFFAPFFLLRIILLVAIVRLLFRGFGRRRMWMHYYDGYSHGGQSFNAPHVISLRHRDVTDISID